MRYILSLSFCVEMVQSGWLARGLVLLFDGIQFAGWYSRTERAIGSRRMHIVAIITNFPVQRNVFAGRCSSGHNKLLAEQCPDVASVCLCSTAQTEASTWVQRQQRKHYRNRNGYVRKSVINKIVLWYYDNWVIYLRLNKKRVMPEVVWTVKIYFSLSSKDNLKLIRS